jgi:hypothetical protein
MLLVDDEKLMNELKTKVPTAKKDQVTHIRNPMDYRESFLTANSANLVVNDFDSLRSSFENFAEHVKSL